MRIRGLNQLDWRWILLVSLCCSGCGGPSSQAPAPSAGPEVDSATSREASPEQVAAFCGNCHAVPSASTFPRDAWHDEVAQGYRFYLDSGRQDLAPPPMSRVVAYYRARAPEELSMPSATASISLSEVRFERQPLKFSATTGGFPAVSHLRWRRMEKGGGELLFCDMKSGDLRRVQFEGNTLQSLALAAASNPAHIEPCDLDADGRVDYVIADLGTFEPEDHAQGSLRWLRQARGATEYSLVTLLPKTARLADVQPADFDGDGDLDLVVAEFGWRKSGSIFLLEQTNLEDEVPVFQRRPLDARHGAIHASVVDLNGDGRLDIVALISQEHETIELFLSLGKWNFERQTLFSAGEPAFGSSGMQLIDLDQDGDLDVLYTNGDTLDSFYLKPYHAVHWLENRGSLSYRQHQLTALPGVVRAEACDLDGDGDLDIVACAHAPTSRLRKAPTQPLDTLIWLEQVKPGRFERHSLERGPVGHMALAVGDFDGDGDSDLAVGNHSASAGAAADWLSIWWNQGSMR